MLRRQPCARLRCGVGRASGSRNSRIGAMWCSRISEGTCPLPSISIASVGGPDFHHALDHAAQQKVGIRAAQYQHRARDVAPESPQVDTDELPLPVGARDRRVVARDPLPACLVAADNCARSDVAIRRRRHRRKEPGFRARAVRPRPASEAQRRPPPDSGRCVAARTRARRRRHRSAPVAGSDAALRGQHHAHHAAERGADPVELDRHGPRRAPC